MSTSNIGQQSIGWKYSTPLKADYLNTLIAGLSGQGLLTRPYFEYGAGTSAGLDVTIHPFSMLINPSDKRVIENGYDENREYPAFKTVKITITTLVSLTILPTDVAIGFKYSFAPEGSPAGQSQWYGDFTTLDSSALADFDGIIIGTVQVYESGNAKIYSIRTNGADISDALLISEGWNPNCWLSVIHPKRTVSGRYNALEVRCHNDLYSGYVSGNSGCVELSNLKYNLDTNIHPEVSNEHGERGFMPYNYNCFSLQSRGFYLSDGADSMPIEKVHGGIFAMVDAYDVNMGPQGMGNTYTFFTNRLKLSPVKQEDINIYFDNNTLVIN